MAFTTVINTSLLTTYIIRKFIPALENDLQISKFTTPAIIPVGGGNIGRFNVFSSPAQAQTTTVTALAEGTTTGGEITTLTTTGTNCTIQEYGEFIKVTQLEELAAVPSTRAELVKRFVYGGARTVDSLVRLQAIQTTTAAYCDATAAGASTTAATTTAASAAAIIFAAGILRDNSADGFQGVAGHENFHFAGIISPKAERQIVNEGTNTTRNSWGNSVVNTGGIMGQERWVKGRIGAIYGTTCYRTQNYTTTALTSSSDNNYIIGDGGLGAVAFGDMKLSVVINDVNSPYKNVNSIAYHGYFGTSLIDSARVVRLYSNNLV